MILNAIILNMLQNVLAANPEGVGCLFIANKTILYKIPTRVNPMIIACGKKCCVFITLLLSLGVTLNFTFLPRMTDIKDNSMNQKLEI